MATALTPPSSSSNNKHWWPRISTGKLSSRSPYPSHLYSGGVPGSRRPHTAAGPPGRPTLMTSVTTSKSTSSNPLTSSSKSSSRFNLAAVIGFGSRSKKQQPVDIQDPPSQVRSLPTSKTNSHKQFGVTPTSTASPNPRFSRGVASSTSGTSRASTDGPLTPADDPPLGSRISYQHSLMTLTDLSDPFATTSPLSERRSSAHSDKSISRRLMHRVDGKAAKATVRLPVGEGPKRKDSRDRSATLPSRARSANDAAEAYQSLRAVEPPWAAATPPDLPSSASLTLPRPVNDEHLKTVRGPSSGTVLLSKSKTPKPGLPWPETKTLAASGLDSLRVHQRTHSSSSLSMGLGLPPDGSRSHLFRASTSSSTSNSVSSSMHTSPLSKSTVISGSGSPTDVRHPVIPQPNQTPATSAQTTPTITAQSARTSPRTSPRPPPTVGLPPTPTPTQTPGPPSYLHPSSPVTEQHPLRARSGTAASASALSFASSLSSLSFTSKPSPQDPPSRGAYEYPSLLGETLPVPGSGTDDVVERRGSNSGSSASGKEPKMMTSNSSAKGSTQLSAAKSARQELTPKPPKHPLPGSRPLPSLPVSLPQATPPSHKRERALSAASSTFSLTPESGKTLRKQRSFHNTSTQAPTLLPQPMLRHYNSFDPSAPPGVGHMRSPLPPPGDLPILPPPSTPATSSSKRSSTGKDSLTSPRRKLFSSHKHDRERERKQEPGIVDTNVQSNLMGGKLQQQTLHHSSSWFDEGSPEPPSASSASTSTAHDVAQHIVPPAELLRLGAAWERENENLNGLRRAKSSWGSRDSDVSHTTYSSSSSRPPLPRSAGSGGTAPSPTLGSKLPRSASLLSKATSAPSFGRPHGPPDLSFTSSSSHLLQESYTSLSPPPRRPQRTVSRTTPHSSAGLPPPPPRRSPSNATASSGSAPPRGALIERKPSFLDMSTRQSVSLDVPDLSDRDEPERDSFLELSRGVDSIDTIRESMHSIDSFMQ